MCILDATEEKSSLPKVLAHPEILPKKLCSVVVLEKAVLRVIGMLMHSGQFQHPTYVHLHPHMRQFFKTLSDPLIKQYRHARRENFVPFYEIEYTTCV